MECYKMLRLGTSDNGYTGHGKERVLWFLTGECLPIISSHASRMSQNSETAVE